MRRGAGAAVPSVLTERLAGKTGRAFWRSLDELAETPAFEAFLEAEFPSLAPDRLSVDRRSLLKVMGASLALAGLTGCNSQGDDEGLPYVNTPEFMIPGQPRWYATALTVGGFAQPALGKTHVGRPVKLEGNSDHPATAGATDPFLQAALLSLYDPDRSQGPWQGGQPSTWDVFDAAMSREAAILDGRGGEGFRLVIGASTSPTMARQIAALTARWPRALWLAHEPWNDNRRREAARRIFGRPVDWHLHLERADVVVSLEDDLLGPGPHQAVHGRRWAERRRSYQRGDGGSRIFVAEPTPSITGTIATARLIAEPDRLAPLVRGIARAVGLVQGPAEIISDREQVWLDRAATALLGARARGVLTVGAHAAPEAQALALLINEHLGNLGQTISFTEPLHLTAPQAIADLLADMQAGRVTHLALIGVNPVYDTSAALGFTAALDKVGFRLHAGLHRDETAARCQWHVPLAHELESWSDARAVDGTVSVIQPLIRPFYDVRGVHSVIDNLTTGQGKPMDLVRQTWTPLWGAGFDAAWEAALVQGFVAGSALPTLTPSVGGRDVIVPDAPAKGDLAVVIRPDPTIWDGRFAHNAWLQETPKPLSKITWGNVAALSPALAQERGLANGDEVRLEAEGRAITALAWITPGQAARTVTLTLGYGRRLPGHIADDLGYDAYAIAAADLATPLGASLTRTGATGVVATTQLHQAMDGFDFVRTVDAPGATAAPRIEQPSFYPPRPYDSPSWGMAIDLDLCFGCNACVVACTSENNVPVVGKELVAEGREMLWLRVDHYLEGDPDDPRSHFQPVPCMHCEQAPCEMGCPVNAAVHSSDGLNLQVYNRCIGTRTCSSYCPYKVRRFNWFDFTSGDPEETKAVRNPDVTVRGRGVMEKCTYCVQRTSAARIEAKKQGRPIRDGEVKTACQQACPAQAITFGDVIAPETEVSRRKADPRNYTLLEEANTRPRTTYLARIVPREDGDPA